MQIKTMFFEIQKNINSDLTEMFTKLGFYMKKFNIN